MANKLKVGLFSFSCCEDSSIILVEMMNDHYKEWSQLIDFRYARILKNKNELSDIDVAFIEGAVSTEKDKQKVLEIRANSKKVVTIGSCACSGLPAGQRNFFNDETRKEVQFLVDKFHLLEKVLSIPQVIPVDDQVPGCPMDEERFLQVLNKYLAEFGITGK